MRVRTVFCSSENSGIDHEVQVYANDTNEIFLSITDPEDPYNCKWVCLDKETAILFSRIIRREISFLS